MGIQEIIFLALGLAIPILVDCNQEGNILHMQRTLWFDPKRTLMTWDPTMPNPCTWLHITCNDDNSVNKINLGSLGLSGTLSPALGGLANLQSLSSRNLADNNLTGKIPSSLANIKFIVNLADNNFSGPIPSSFLSNKNVNLVTTGNPMMCATGQSCESLNLNAASPPTVRTKGSSVKKNINNFGILMFFLLSLSLFAMMC